jgi:hypothetical protein
MPRLRTSAALLAAAFFLIGSAQATVIYDEGTSGDLPKADLPPFPNFELQPGENEVKGTLIPPDDADDNFEIVIPPGFKVDDIILKQEGNPEDEPGGFITDLWIFPMADPSAWDAVLYVNHGDTPPGGKSLKDTPPTSIFPGPIEDILPFIQLEPYRIEIKASGDPNYSITFLVSPIPEPSALALLACGAMALVRFRMRTPPVR